MDQDEIQTSTSRKVVKTTNDVIVFGAIAFSAYNLARLGYDLGKEGVKTLKAKKNNQIED